MANRRLSAKEELRLLLSFPSPRGALSGLEQYLAAIEEQLPYLKSQYGVRLSARLNANRHLMDAEEIQDEEAQISYVTEDLFPRVFLAGFILSLWAVFESAVTDLADYAKSQRAQLFSVGDLRGGDFLAQAMKYFERVLDVRLLPDRHTLDRIELLKAIRNAFVHHNGRITKEIEHKINSSNLQDIGFKRRRDHGADHRREYIFLTEQGARNYLDLVKGCLNDLAMDVFKKLHPESRCYRDETQS